MLRSDQVADQIDEQRTKLMAFFNYNAEHSEARTFL
jgi:hypothetical protein